MAASPPISLLMATWTSISLHLYFIRRKHGENDKRGGLVFELR